LLLLGRLVSSSGDWLYTIGISVSVYLYSGHNSVAVGVLFLVRMLPYVLLSSYAGVLADRLGPRTAMIVADLSRMAAVAVLAVALSSSTWLAIYPIVFIVTAFNALFRPASVAIIPSLVNSDDELLAANATLMQADNIALLAGSLIGGVVASQGYVTLLLVVQALTFGVSALSLFAIHPRVEEASDPEGEAAAAAATAGSSMLRGLRLIWERPVLLFVMTVILLPEFVSGATVVWVAPYSFHVLHLGNAGIGYLYAAIGVGSLLGGFLVAFVGGDKPLDTALMVSVAAGGAAVVLFGAVPIGAVALVALGLLGAAETVEFAVLETLVQAGVPKSLIGTAMGAVMSICMICMLLGNVISGVLVLVPGLQQSLVIMGVLVMVVSVVMWANYRRQLAKLPAESVLLRVPAFAALPADLQRWAMQRMERIAVSAGTVLMRQGEIGDRLYVIAEGTVGVQVTGEGIVRKPADIGPGEVVGEIALLHDVPRTATVTAKTPVVAYTLTREDVNDLLSRATDLRESLLQIASSRLEYSGALRLALNARS
jgi:predicted MFS family arabinose efflux permease